MGRPLRVDAGGLVYHVLNRGNALMTLFEEDADYAAFERIMQQAQQRTDMRILSYCLMPNHWHLMLWPRRDGDLSRFVGWLTLTHTQRWHAHHQTTGSGHVYQGRYKSFLVERDGYAISACRYVERNALRAGLVDRAEDWRWGSLWRWVNRRKRLEDVPTMCDWPMASGGRPRNWRQRVNQPQTEAELQAMRLSITRGRPLGDAAWVRRMSNKHD